MYHIMLIMRGFYNTLLKKFIVFSYFSQALNLLIFFIEKMIYK